MARPQQQAKRPRIAGAGWGGSWGGGGQGRGGGGGAAYGKPRGGYGRKPLNQHNTGDKPDGFEVTLMLISATHFGAKSRYNETLNGVWRQHGGGFDRDAGHWKLPLSAYSHVVRDVKSQNLKTDLRELPRLVTQSVHDGVFSTGIRPDGGGGDGTGEGGDKAKVKAKVKTCGGGGGRPTKMAATVAEAKALMKRDLPPGLHAALLPFQHDGVATIIQRGGVALLGDEMGLGKTLQALAVAHFYSDAWPLLIVCPSSLRHTWAAEIEKWLEIGQESIQIIKNGKERPHNLICIVSYDLTTKMPTELKKFKVVIADECHYLKSIDTKRTKALVPAIKNAKHKLLLSGTPALSRPIELFSQLNALMPTMFDSRATFGIRYCNAYQGQFGWDFTGSSNAAELHIVMASTVLVRRLKRDVLTQLPPKTRQQIYVEPVPGLRKQLTELEKQRGVLDNRLKSADASSKQAIEMQKRALTIKMYQITGQSKLPESLNYLEDLMEKGIKTLVFAHHRGILDAVADKLSKKKIKHIRIDGGTAQQIRQELCDQFQTDDQTRAAVLSITAAGVGLTLHAAATVVFFELAWNPGQLLQAEDRAHRMGQQRTVDIKYMVAKGTADQSQWNLLERKISVVGQSVNGTHDTMALNQDNDTDAAAAGEGSGESLSVEGDPAAGKHRPGSLLNHFKAAGVDERISSGHDAEHTEKQVASRQSAPAALGPASAVRAVALVAGGEAAVTAMAAARDDGDVVEMRPCPICAESFQWFLIDQHAAECVTDFAAGAFSGDDDDDGD